MTDRVGRVSRTVRRRRWSDALPLLVLLGLGGLLWTLRAPLVALWRPHEAPAPITGPEPSEPGDGSRLVEEAPTSALEEEARIGEHQAAPSADAGSEEAAASTGATGHDAPQPGFDARPAGAVAAQGPSPTGAAPPSEAGQPPPAVIAGRSRTGLRSYRLDPEQAASLVADAGALEAGAPDAGAPAAGAASDAARGLPDPQALDPLAEARRQFEATPHDDAAAAALVTALMAAGRTDEALEALADHAASGGDPAATDVWRASLDATAGERAALVDLTVGGLLEVAQLALQSELWLSAAALLDGAARCTTLAGHEADADARRRLAVLDGEIEAARATLFRSRAATASLAAFGAPLPEDLDVRATLREASAALVTARAEARGELPAASSRHAHVAMARGSAAAGFACELIEALHEHLVEETGRDPWRSGVVLQVEVLDDEDAYASRRAAQEPQVPDRVDAFLEEPHRILARDPETLGASVDALWGQLASEAARAFLRDAYAAAPLPVWLEEALVAEVADARILADGRPDLDGGALPRADRRQGAMDRREGPPALGLVLTQYPGERAGPLWAAAFWRYLSEATDADGQPLWGDPLSALLADTTQGLEPPQALLMQVVAPAAERTGIATLAALDAAWHAWEREQFALDSGEPDAVAALLARTQRDIAARRFAPAERALARVRTVLPAHPEALALAAQLGRRSQHTDEGLLAARLLAACRQPGGSWLPGNAWQARPLAQREAAERLRYAEALELHAPLGEALARLDARVRTAAEALLEQQVQADLPRSALRLLDTLLGIWPLDAGYEAARAALRQGPLADAAQGPRRVPPLLGDGSRVAGSSAAVALDAGRLQVRGADSIAPLVLRGLSRLEPPWHVTLEVRFRPGSGGEVTDDGKRFAGLLFGAEDTIGWGEWGVLVTPAGSIELATSGHLEWPSQPVGRGARGGQRLEVAVEGQRLEIRSDGERVALLDLGVRQASGWLTLYARRADVDLGPLVVEHPRRPEPGALWWVTPH